MQKTVRINLIARNSAAKRAQKTKAEKTKRDWKNWHEGTNRQMALNVKYRQEERLNRRQDWMAGTLAPNRDSGTEKGVFGTMSIYATVNPDVPKSIRAGPKSLGYDFIPDVPKGKRAFTGDTIVGNVVVNDRVVIFAGPERLRGLVGTVTAINLDKEEVTLKNINTTDIKVPAYTQPPRQEGDPPPVKITAQDVSIPMSHVRLVMTVSDDSGKYQDVIIRHVHAGPPYVQQPIGSNLPSHTRYVTGPVSESGEEFAIPWPKDVINDDSQSFNGDTIGQAVTNYSWIPSLYGPPLGYSYPAVDKVEAQESQYSRGEQIRTIDTEGPGKLNNGTRAGISSFVDDDKLQARRLRIAEGILGELRSKYKSGNLRHDDSEWVKKKMIEDARAIWYGDRELVSARTQAAELAVKKQVAERSTKQEDPSVMKLVQDVRAIELGKPVKPLFQKQLAMKLRVPLSNIGLAQTHGIGRDLSIPQMQPPRQRLIHAEAYSQQQHKDEGLSKEDRRARSRRRGSS